MSTYKEVWENLRSIDCSEHTQEKNGLTYLSWAWAWATLMEEYPDAAFRFHDNEVHIDGTVTVYCTINIGELERTMWLPVMSGFKNQAVSNPNARDVSDAKMRCLVKCMALYGLGHYIYAGEDVPSGKEEPKQEKPKAKPAKAKQPPKQKEELPLIAQGEHGLEGQLEKKLENTGEWDEQFCQEVCDLVISFAEVTDTPEGVRDLHVANKAMFDKIKGLHPEVFENYKSQLTAIKARKEAAEGAE